MSIHSNVNGQPTKLGSVCKSSNKTPILHQSVLSSNNPAFHHNAYYSPIKRNPLQVRPFTNYQMPPQLNKQNWIGSASAQVKPILYQSEDNPACNKGTRALYGQATSLDGGRFHPAATILRHSTIIDQSMSILYQSISNLVRIHQQSYIDQASANYVPIYCQSNVNPVQI